MQVCAKGDTFPPGPQGYLDQGVGCDCSLGYKGTMRTSSSEERRALWKPATLCFPLPFSLLPAHPGLYGVTWLLYFQNSLLSPDGSNRPICNWPQNPCFYFIIAQRFFFFLNARPCSQGFLFDTPGGTLATCLGFCLLSFFNLRDSLGWDVVHL